jgi:3-oxosteroid 1-dehydrogenase
VSVPGLPRMKFDHSTDVLVIGSGGGALASALTASILGAETLVVEKTNLYGGTSANSGGNIWIPNGHHTNASPYPDSREKALAYLRAAIGSTVAPATIEAFVDSAPAMLKFLEDNSHVRFEARAYCDYYPELPGGKPEGYRTHEPVPLHARHLGKDFATLRPSHHSLVLMGRYSWTNAEGTDLLTQSPGWQWTVVRMLARYWLDIPGRLQGRRSRYLTGGNALIGRLRYSLNDRRVPVWLESPMVELVVEQGRVRGAVVERAGQRVAIEARRGVVMGAGGFEHNREMRERYLPAPNSADWSASSTGNTGDAIRAGMAIGGAVALMERAWWIPVICAPGVERPWGLFAERSSPGQIIVDRRGLRYTNEAAPYLECGIAMFQAPGGTEVSVPSFIVFDAEFRRKYPLGCFGPGAMFPDEKMPAAWEGIVYHKAETLEALARKAGIDAAGLAETVRLNNEYARTGKDPEFHRGDSAYDRYYADQRVKPNPCIAPIAKPPFYAVVIRPGDTGTNGGLLTDEHARVMSSAGSPIPGLYAIGNTAACVMGTTYPGAGATIGPCMTFGYVAARHALGAQ